MMPGQPAGSSPARIGRYEIVERIGKGAMGVVYSARDEVMDRLVAVKVMMADLEGEPDTRTRFYREAQAAGRLLHPNIITIFDMGEDEGRIYIVMELLKGETLGEYLRQPGLPLEKKIDLMVQTCEGLAAAHASGIVHRDIKPGNLFVLHDGSLKILDFGVARLASSTMTASGFIIGTPDYMSPEQARGSEIDARSDVFSAAAVFYYMLCGRKPFGARDLPTVLRKVQSEPPPPLSESEAPPFLARVVTRSLSKDPAHRHQSMAELAADLTRFKRHYEAETRQVAAVARGRYDAIQALLKERAALDERLGLEPCEEPEASVRLREEHPAFVERAPELLLVPFTRAQAQAVAEELTAACGPLERGLPERRLAAQAVEAAEKALAERRAEDAAAAIAAAQPLPDSAVVQDLRRRCGEAVAAHLARVARLDALAADARAAADAGDWPAVIARCEEGGALDADRPDLKALAARAREAVERAARERERARQQATAAARRAIADRRFEAAEEEIGRAREAGTPSDEIADIAVLLAQAREVAAAEAALAKKAAEVISLARAEFHAGHRAEGLAVLRRCLEEEAAAPGVRAELQHLEAEARRVEELERRRAEAEAHAVRAASALSAGEVSVALSEASAALALDVNHAQALRVRASAQAQVRAEAEARERRVRASEHLARARALMQAGSLAKALREAEHGLELEAGSADASALIEEVRKRQADEDAARERAREVQNELRSARQVLRNGDVDAAERAVERALALDASAPAALALRADIAAARERLRRRRELEDETVAVAAAPAAGRDSEDTVNLAPAHLGVGRLFNWLGALLGVSRRGR